MSPYPRWRYFPSYAAPPDWVAPVVAVFSASLTHIDSAVTHAKPMQSNDVLGVIASGLQALNFTVETGKQKAAKLPRPVFFGDEEVSSRTYEIVALSPARESPSKWRPAAQRDRQPEGPYWPPELAPHELDPMRSRKRVYPVNPTTEARASGSSTRSCSAFPSTT